MRMKFNRAAVLLAAAATATLLSVGGATATATNTVETEQPTNKPNRDSGAKEVEHLGVHPGCYENKASMAIEDEQFRARLNLACRLVNGFLMPPGTPDPAKVESYLTNGFVQRTGSSSVVDYFIARLVPAVYELETADHYDSVGDTLTLKMSTGDYATFGYVTTSDGLKVSSITYS